MNSKNWSDRADRDLFFTILSVKNIGVISGSEWVTIGNHMRVLGYGFTNEGCRQHFQGLRRAQNKTEQNGSNEGGPASVRKSADPTLNPITRRPGPGRGRPKKSNGEQAATAQQPAPASVPSPIGDVPTQVHDVAGQPGPGSTPHFPHHHYQQSPQGQHSMPYPHQGHHPWQTQPPPQYVHPGPQDHHHRPQPQMVQKQQQGGQQQSPIPLPTQPVAYPSPQSANAQMHRPVAAVASNQAEPVADKATASGTGDNPNAPRPLPLETDHGDDDEPDDEDDEDDDDVSDDRPSKRQKTEDEDAEGDGNLEDDPVLALANASNGGSGDPYNTSDQFYGEA